MHKQIWGTDFLKFNKPGFITSRALGFGVFETVIRSTMLRAFNLRKSRTSIRVGVHGIACFNWHSIVGHKHLYRFGFTTARVLGFRGFLKP